MTNSKRLESGATAQLPAGHLRARLVGAVESAVLRVAGEPLPHDGSAADATMLVRQALAAATLSVVPRGGETFAPGTQLGVELESVGGEGSSPLVQVPAQDVGGYRECPLVWVDGTGSEGWQARLPGQADSSPLGLLRAAFAPQDAVPFDERHAPWLTSGRYLLRTSRHGEASPPQPRRWAMIVDDSASMRNLLDEEAFGLVVDTLAGVMVESTRSAPEFVALTIDPSPEPATVVAEPPSARLAWGSIRTVADWTLLGPVVAECTRRGVQELVCLLDAPPADLPQVARQRQVDVRCVVLSGQALEPDQWRAIDALFGGLDAVGLSLTHDDSWPAAARHLGERVTR